MEKKDKKSLVFFESYPTEMLAKLSKHLRAQGYFMVLIYVNEGSADGNVFVKEAYDKIIALNDSKHRGIKKIPEAVKVIKDLNPLAVLYRSLPEAPGVVLNVLLNKKCPFIYFPYDLISVIPMELTNFRRKMKYQLEARSQKFLINHSDGIVHKGSENELDYVDETIFGKNFKIKCPTLQFLPYCSEDFFVPMRKHSRMNKEIHLVYIGSSDDTPILANQIRAITNSKLHLHMYTRSMNKGQNYIYDLMKASPNLREFADNPYFHLHKSLGAKEIIKAISKYDYGIYLASPMKLVKNAKAETGSGNKVASYLEAGIPTLYYNVLEFTGEIVEKYGIGMGFPYEAKDWNTIIRQKDYSTLLKNIKKAREEFTFKNNLSHFEKFLDKVQNYHAKRIS